MITTKWLHGYISLLTFCYRRSTLHQQLLQRRPNMQLLFQWCNQPNSLMFCLGWLKKRGIRTWFLQHYPNRNCLIIPVDTKHTITSSFIKSKSKSVQWTTSSVLWPSLCDFRARYKYLFDYCHTLSVSWFCLLYLVVCPCFLVSPFCFSQNMRNPFSTLESSAVGKWYRTQNNNDNLTRIGTLYFFVSWCNPVTCIQLLPKPDCIVIWLFWVNKHCMCNKQTQKIPWLNSLHWWWIHY